MTRTMPEKRDTAERRVLETRLAPISVTRAEAEDKTKIATLSGYAAVFEEEIEMGGPIWGWREMIMKGAFVDTIKEDDPRGLYNHDTSLLLARQSAKTLRLKEDDKGLTFSMDLPDTSYARDLLAVVERGDMSGMSFGFDILEETSVRPGEHDPEKRTLWKINKVKLHEISPVTFPAYEGTSVSVATRDRRGAETTPKNDSDRERDIRLRMARLDRLEEAIA